MLFEAVHNLGSCGESIQNANQILDFLFTIKFKIWDWDWKACVCVCLGGCLPVSLVLVHDGPALGMVALDVAELMNLANEAFEIGQLFEQIGGARECTRLDRVEVVDGVQPIVDGLGIAEWVHEPVLEQSFAERRAAEVEPLEERACLRAVLNVLDHFEIRQRDRVQNLFAHTTPINYL